MAAAHGWPRVACSMVKCAAGPAAGCRQAACQMRHHRTTHSFPVITGSLTGKLLVASEGPLHLTPMSLEDWDTPRRMHLPPMLRGSDICTPLTAATTA